MPIDMDELLFVNGQPGVRARMRADGSVEIPMVGIASTGGMQHDRYGAFGGEVLLARAYPLPASRGLMLAHFEGMLATDVGIVAVGLDVYAQHGEIYHLDRAPRASFGRPGESGPYLLSVGSHRFQGAMFSGGVAAFAIPGRGRLIAVAPIPFPCIGAWLPCLVILAALLAAGAVAYLVSGEGGAGAEAAGQATEAETFRRLITDTGPTGPPPPRIPRRPPPPDRDRRGCCCVWSYEAKWMETSDGLSFENGRFGSVGVWIAYPCSQPACELDEAAAKLEAAITLAVKSTKPPLVEAEIKIKYQSYKPGMLPAECFVYNT
ncbi:MAG: hypothetical protein HYZ53_25050 [Planctomycetes bacterium]|nr:hypothetical protein [Planctomycetota bacterium]